MAGNECGRCVAEGDDAGKYPCIESSSSSDQVERSLSSELSAKPCHISSPENFPCLSKALCSSDNISLPWEDSAPQNLKNSEVTTSVKREPSSVQCEQLSLHTSDASHLKRKQNSLPVSEASPAKRIAESLTTSFMRVKILHGHSEDITCVGADGSLVVSASTDTTIRVWDASNGTETCTLHGHTSSVTCVILLTAEDSEILVTRLSLKETSRIVVSGSLDCTLRLWSLPKGEEISSVYTFNGITCAQYLVREVCVVIGTDGGKLELWNIGSSKCVDAVNAHEDSLSDIYTDGCLVYTASGDGRVKVWEVVGHQSLHLLYSRERKEVCKNTDCLTPCNWKSIRSFNNCLYLADGSEDLKVLHWKSGKLKIHSSHMKNSGTSDTLCLYGNNLVSSSFDFDQNAGAIHVWQLPEMKYICSMLGPLKRVYSLAVTYTEDGMLRIVSGGVELILWDFDFSQPCLKKHDNSFYCDVLDHPDVEPMCAEQVPCVEGEKSRRWCSVM